MTGRTRDELRIRREESLKAHLAREDEKYKAAEKKKLEQDKHSID